ncbi:MAG: pentapeptide repeat-containing protein, partial [Cyanobacteria bacterium J06632_19]
MELNNACFAYSNFRKSKFNQVIIKNCNFPDCNFSDSFLGIISIEDVGFRNSNFTGAKINAISLGQNSIGTRSKIKEVSYLNLLATAVTGKKSKFFSGHTDFSAIEVLPSNNGEEQKHLSYISWYQDTMLKYREETNFLEKIGNIASALTTKNWRSLVVVFFTCVALIILFS